MIVSMRSTRQLGLWGLLLVAASMKTGAQLVTRPVEVRPQTAYRGEPEVVTASFIGNGCTAYWLSWQAEPTPISSVLTWYLVLKINATPTDICIPVETFMQIQDTLKNLNAGRYIVRYDSASAKRYDLRDTVQFTVQNLVSSIATRPRSGPLLARPEVALRMPDLLGRPLKARGDAGSGASTPSSLRDRCSARTK